MSEDNRYLFRDNNRRKWIVSNPKEWTLDIKSNVICELNVKIENELWDELINLSQTVNYLDIENKLRMYFWAKNEILPKLKEKFKPFEEDIIEWLFISQDGTKDIRPHSDHWNHHDSSKSRSSCFYIPLSPKGDDYVPLELYYGENVYGIPPNDKPKVYMWNCKLLHAVFTNEKNIPRYNIQISLKKSYQEIFKKYKNFFKT